MSPMASKALKSPPKEVAITSKSSKKRKENTDIQDIRFIAQTINMCKDIVFGKSLPTVKGRVIGGDLKNVTDSLIAEEIYLQSIVDLLECSTIPKDFDYRSIIDLFLNDFALYCESNEMKVFMHENRYYAYCHCKDFLLTFENDLALLDSTASLMREKTKRKVLCLTSTQTPKDPTNIRATLSFVFGLLQLTPEDFKSYIIDQVPLSDIMGEFLEDILEEDEKEISEEISKAEPIASTSKSVSATSVKEEKPLSKSVVPAKEEKPLYKLPDKRPSTVTEVSEDEKSDFEIITDVLFDIIDAVMPDFKLSHIALVTIIVTQLASIIILARNFKQKISGFSSLVSMQVVGLLSTIYVFLIHGGFLSADHDISLSRIKNLLMHYLKPPKEYYNLTDDPNTLILHSPTAAQLVQLRTYDLEFFKNIPDEKLIPLLVSYPSKLLTHAQLTEIKNKSKECTQQIDIKNASFFFDKFLGPIGIVFALLSCDPKSILAPAFKNLFSVVDNAKKYSRSLKEIKEQLIEFFLPQETYTTKLIEQREENLKAIQPSLASLAVNHKEYQRLIQAKLQSASLFKGIMSHNGKNEMFRMFTQSACAVDAKIFEYQKLVENSVGRQEPVGFHFYGDVGIGKTTFITRQLCGIVADKLGLNPNTYNTKPNPDGFYSVYAGEAFAYMDEVGDTADGSTEFALINTLMSSISQHIPSAFIKEQPFLSKFLLLISNYNLHEVSGTIKKKSKTATAFRSRFIEIHVTNPSVQNTSSRGADPSWFANENFRFNMKRYHLDDTCETKEISLNELVDLMVSEYRIKLDNFKKHLERFPEAQSGARGSPFSISLVGPQGTGKTQLAYSILEEIKLLGADTVVVEDIHNIPSEFKPASVVLLNDLITVETLNDENSLHQLHQLENLGANGIVINTSNVSPTPLPWYYFLTSWVLFRTLIIASYMKGRPFIPIIYKQLFKQEGLYRRTGYSGTFWHNGSILIVNEASVMTIHSQEGFEFFVRGIPYTAETVKNEIYDHIQEHRGMRTQHFKETTHEERVASDWNVYCWANSVQEFVEEWNSFSLSKIGTTVGKNQIAIRISAMDNANVNPDVLLSKKFTPANLLLELNSLLTYIVTTNPHIRIVIRIGDCFFWNEGLSIYTNHILPHFTIEDEIDSFKADGLSFDKEELVNFFIKGNSNTVLRKQVVLTKLRKHLIVPKIISEEYKANLEQRSNTVTISKTKILYNALKTEFKQSPIFYIAAFLLFLLCSNYIIRLFTSKKDKSRRQQAVRYNLGFGVSKTSGHRYMTRNGQVIYSDDEENFNETVYRDYGMASSDDDDWYVQSRKEPEQAKRTVVIPERQYHNYARIAHSKAPRKNLKLVLPEGANYLGVQLTVRNTMDLQQSFEAFGSEVWTCDNLCDILTLDNNVNAMGFDSIDHMISAVNPGKRHVYITTTKRYPLSVIGLTSVDIDLLKHCKEQYICSIISQPIAFNKICNLNTGEIIPCSFEEVKFIPETYVGIKKYRSLPKKFYRIINFPQHQQMLSIPVRKPDEIDLLSKKIKNNAVVVSSDAGKVCGFYVEEGFVLTVKHVYATNLRVEEEGKKPLEVEQIYHASDDSDSMLLRVKGSSGHPSLLSSFKLVTDSRVEVKLVGMSYESDITTTLGTTVVNQPVMNGTISLYRADSILIGPSSTIPTRAGDCGRPYITTNKYMTPKIVGIHVAASMHDIIACKIDPEWLTTICRVQQQSLLRYDVPGFRGELQLMGKNPRTINSPTKPYSTPSRLAKYMHDLVPSMKRPAKVNISECTPEELAKLALDANGIPDFYLGQILQYNDPIKDLPPKSCSAYVSGFTSHYHKYLVQNKAGNVLSESEILNGIQTPSDPLFGCANSMNWNGAIGYEAQTKYQHCHIMSDIVEHTSNGAVFNTSPCATFVQSKIDQHISSSWEGIKIDDILQDNLKQENRENEKAYKQRVFTSFPKSLSALVRFFLLRFSAVLTKHHCQLPFKIGVNSNAEWHFEFMKHVAFGGTQALGFGFDLSRCDKHMGAFFFERVLKPLFQYTVKYNHSVNTCNCGHSEEEHLRAIDVVVSHLYDNIIASQDMLYRKTRGNSSGSDLTILINSIYVDFMLFCWFRSTAKHSGAFPPTFAAYVEIIYRMVCGDDGKVLVAKCGQKHLTFNSFKAFCAVYGVLVDTPEKDGGAEGLRPMLEIPFISRKWIRSPNGFYIPKFKIEIISGLCYWTRYDTTEQYDETLRTLSTFICPYGEEFYNKFYNAALLYQQDYASYFVVPTYKEALFEIERQVPGLAVLQCSSEKISNYSNNLFKIQMAPSHNQPIPFFEEEMEVEIPEVEEQLDIGYDDSEWQAEVWRVFIGNIALSRSYLDPLGYSEMLRESAQDLIDEFINYIPSRLEYFDEQGDNSHFYREPKHPYLAAKYQFGQEILDLVEERCQHFPGRYYTESYLDWLVNTVFPLSFEQMSEIPVVQMERSVVSESSASMPMERMNNVPMQAAINTVAMGDASTMAIPHLPQLATVVAPPAVPTLENMPIDNTINMHDPQQTRTIGLPTDTMAFGGILENFQDVAEGSYQYVNTITINVNQQPGTEVFRIPYGLDLLGGYAAAWVNLHKRYSGPILVKFTIISSSIVQGRLRIGWDVDPAVKTNGNSSKFGAADFDLSQPSNTITMMIQPVAGPTGRFYFINGETPVDQPYLFGVLLTPLTNNFSDLGSIQVLVESRLAPGFIVADPIDITPVAGTRTLVSNVTSIDYLFKDLDKTKTTIFLESRKYPKFPNYPANAYPTDFDLRPTDPLFQFESDLVPDRPTVLLNNSHHYTDASNSALIGPTRHKSVRYTNQTAQITGEVSVTSLNDINLGFYTDVNISGDAIIAEHVFLDDSTTPPHITRGKSISIDSKRFPPRTDGTVINRTVDVTTGASDVITADLHDADLDSKLLPVGYVVCEFADTITPAVRASAVANGSNIIPRNTFGWILHNYCYQNCAPDGQIKISIVDKTFNENLIEILYRPDTGFYTRAPPEKFYTFFNANIGNYNISASTVSAQTSLNLSVDLGNFTSFVQPAEQQMFQVVGGMFGGLGSGLTNMANQNFQMDYLRQQGQNNRMNIAAQGDQTRQTLAYRQRLNNFGSNLYNSPMNGAASIFSNQGTQTSHPVNMSTQTQMYQPKTLAMSARNALPVQPQTSFLHGNRAQMMSPGTPGTILDHTGTMLGHSLC